MKLDIKVNDCPVQSVTVFNDRAEVTRKIPISSLITTALSDNEISSDQEFELNILGITGSANKDSYRVKGEKCTIIEVVFHDRILPADAQKSEELQELSNELAVVSLKLAEASQIDARLHTSKNLIEQYTTQSIAGMCESLKQSPITQISTISENITHLIQYGQEKTKEIHDELNGNNQSINNLKDQETVLKNQISKLKSSLSSSSYLRLCQDVCVRFVTSEKVVQTMIDDLGITLTYFVSGAKWSASYDVRVNSVTREMMVNYFGEIIQTSGEDWNDCNLILSTSVPSISSQPPELKKKTIGYEEYAESLMLQEQCGTLSSMRRSSAVFKKNDRPAPEPDEKIFPQTTEALVKSNNEFGTTVFIIAHRTTIPSDGKSHRTSITNVSSVGVFMHYVVPSCSSYVYLLSSMINESEYQFLPSSKVSVFLDGNFVSNTTIGSVMPGSMFHVFLGVDNSISVVYATEELKKKTETVSMSWLPGNDAKLKNKKECSQKCIIKNNKPVCTQFTNERDDKDDDEQEQVQQQEPQRPISNHNYIIVVENVPQSKDEDIRVSINEPNPNTIWRLPMEKNPLNSQQQDSPLLPVMQQASSRFSGTHDYELVVLIVMLMLQKSSPAAERPPMDIVVQNGMSNNLVFLKSMEAGTTMEFSLNYDIVWNQGSRIQLFNY